MTAMPRLPRNEALAELLMYMQPAVRVRIDWQECEHGVIKDAAKPCEHGVYK